MKKKLLSLILCVAMVASLAAGCGNTEEAATDAPTAEETVEEAVTEESGYKLGISVLTMSGQFFIDLVDSARATIEDMGGELIVNDADNSAETQVAAVENFISAGVDGIIICAVDVEAVASIIAEAKAEGIAVVCLTSKVEGYDAYIGADEYLLG